MDTITQDSQAGRSVPRISFTPAEAAKARGFREPEFLLRSKSCKLVARKDGKATIIEASELARYVRELPPRDKAA